MFTQNNELWRLSIQKNASAEVCRSISSYAKNLYKSLVKLLSHSISRVCGFLKATTNVSSSDFLGFKRGLQNFHCPLRLTPTAEE
jgi:hypothetical protein